MNVQNQSLKMGLSLQKLANLVHNSNSEENRRMCSRRAPGLKIITMSLSKLYDPMSSTVATEEHVQICELITEYWNFKIILILFINIS